MITASSLSGPRLNAEQRRLLKLFGALSAQDKASLLAFAEFLSVKGGDAPVAPEGPRHPDPAPRPPDESVVAAMRRLSAGYPMLERGDLLNDAAALMAAHTLQGRPAPEVIDDLEQLFERAHRRYLDAFDKP